MSHKSLLRASSTLACSIALALCACSSSSSSGGGGGTADSGSPMDSGGGGGDSGGGGNTVTVTVGANGGLTFSPAAVMIHVGDTVKWEWAASGHSVTSGSGCTADNKFCSPSDSSCSTGTTSASGASYSHTFTTAGTFPYFCSPHCASGMVGTVTVQ